jgi:hypothetical protein
MYYYLVGALKRRLILELQDSFSKHPVYYKIVRNIQNKFSFDERPQFGIVVKGSSANKVQFAPDNFVGTVQSHVMLAYVGQPTYPLEWIREDIKVVGEHTGMPILPGVYFIEILSAPQHAQEPGYFAMDPMLTQTDEALLLMQSGIEREAQLQQTPVRNTVRIWENGRVLLKEGSDFRVDYERGHGEVELLKSFQPGTKLIADYRYSTPSVGPVEFYWNSSDDKTLPGVVLAFGKRAKAGDKVAVVVYPDRVDSAQAFGGKFEATFDVDVIARDTIQVEEIADLAVMYLWGQKKSVLEFEGIEIVDISIGGEAEDTYDENADTMFYTASMSIQLRADWEIHVPLPLTISRATTQKIGPLGGPGLEQVANDLYFRMHVNKNTDFERIG